MPTMADTTIYALAGEAYDWFEVARRATGDTEGGPREDGEEFIRVKDGAPGWITQMVYSAHGDFLPDDWRYACIRSALAWIHDNEPEDVADAHEFADAEVDVYTGARLAWLASNLQRQFYCDEAQSEFGIDPDAGVVDRIGLGQYAEASEVYAAVVAALTEQLDEP